MDNHHIKPRQRIHPLVATAAASVVLVSLVGVAAITGLLPDSRSSTPAPSVAPSAYSQANAVPPVAYAQLAPAQAAMAQPDAAQAGQQALMAVPPSQYVASSQAYPAGTTVVDTGVVGGTAPYADRQLGPQTYPAQPYASQTYVPAGPPVIVQEPARVVPVKTEARPVKRTAALQDSKPAVCKSCGTVASVQRIETPAERGSGVGAGVGTLVGGLLGSQIGGGSGKQIATVAGAVGGGVLGNQIERNSRKTVSYRVRIEMQDGSMRTFTRSSTNWQPGDRVRVVNGDIRPR